MATEYGTVKYVTYNEGNDDDGRAQERVGLILADKGGTKLDLFVLNDDGGYVQRDVPQREPEDYGDEGGGVTWYYPRD